MCQETRHEHTGPTTLPSEVGPAACTTGGVDMLTGAQLAILEDHLDMVQLESSPSGTVSGSPLCPPFLSLGPISPTLSHLMAGFATVWLWVKCVPQSSLCKKSDQHATTLGVQVMDAPSVPMHTQLTGSGVSLLEGTN